MEAESQRNQREQQQCCDAVVSDGNQQWQMKDDIADSQSHLQYQQTQSNQAERANGGVA
jgi:hypothetical protein